ncbi:MAG: hypothetical protein Q7T48_07125 [Cellvibrio sp.]|uniref:hypothetical protein n=1 Tax=Cellvibrio sp. TaxID=1965322 RepID=UPI00272811AB|nr:hypothetical protein [Cellvibrio sp.]
MYYFEKISARQITLLALGLWIFSLFFSGLVLYYEQQHISGFEILLTGWLSPLDGNFSWYANIFFLLCVFYLFIGRTPKICALIAALLSLDTFRYSMLTMNEGGHSTPIYGYGWGAIIWLISICAIFIAIDLKQNELKKATGEQKGNKIFLIIGFILLVSVVGLSIYHAHNDRVIANKSETKRLQTIAFKRGAVCSVEGPFVYQPLVNFSGTLEVVVDEKVSHAAYPFSEIEQLLSWGIPKIRVGSVDYFYESSGGVHEVSSVQSYKRPDVTLYVNEIHLQSIRAVLVENTKTRVIFDQVWTWENHQVNTRYFCPEYFSYPKSDQQPRKLLMQALGLYSDFNKE